MTVTATVGVTVTDQSEVELVDVGGAQLACSGAGLEQRGLRLQSVALGTDGHLQRRVASLHREVQREFGRSVRHR